MHVGRRAIALAVALAALALAGPAGAHRTDAAAPYIEKPGVVRDFSGVTVARFTAKVWCGKWKGIAVFHVGKGGQGVFDKTTFICDNAKSTTVHFSLNVSELVSTATAPTSTRCGSGATTTRARSRATRTRTRTSSRTADRDGGRPAGARHRSSQRDETNSVESRSSSRSASMSASDGRGAEPLGRVDHLRQQVEIAGAVEEDARLAEHPVHGEIDVLLLDERLVPGHGGRSLRAPGPPRDRLDRLHRDAARAAEAEQALDVGGVAPRPPGSRGCRARAPSRTRSARGCDGASRRPSSRDP